MDDKQIESMVALSPFILTGLIGIIAYFFKKTLNSIENSLKLLTFQHTKVFTFITRLQVIHNRNHPDDKIGELDDTLL